MRYWLQRIVLAITLLLAVSALTFGAMNILGDPLFNILGPVAGDTGNPESVVKIEAAKQQYHLDRALPVRYGIWLSDMLHGDLGVQFGKDGRPPVSNLIKERIPRTGLLAADGRVRRSGDRRAMGVVRRPERQQGARQGLDGRLVPAGRPPQLRPRRHVEVHPGHQARLVPADVQRQGSLPQPDESARPARR